MSSQTNEEKEINIVPKKRVKKKKAQNYLKKPLSPYLLFCVEKRAQEKDKKYTAKELGELWNRHSEQEKKPYYDKYESEKKEYEQLKAELEKNKSDEESKDEDEEEKNKNHKAKAKTKKAQNRKNNNLPCNCGICDDCIIRIKNKEEEEEEFEDNELAKKKAKRAVNDENDD